MGSRESLLRIRTRYINLVTQIKSHVDQINLLNKRLYRLQKECKHPNKITTIDYETFWNCPDCGAGGLVDLLDKRNIGER